jgi:hypothetical protein
MTAHNDDLIRAFIAEGREELPDRAFDAVRGDIHRTRQRVVIGPWREPQMSNLAKVAIAAAAVVAVLFGASRLLPPASGPGTTTPSPTPSPTVTPTGTPAPTPTGAFGGTVGFTGDGGAPGTTAIDAVATGDRVSGTAVTTLRQGIHTVRLACAARDGDDWVVGGKVEKSTIPGEPAGTWSAVLVKDGSPQRIFTWLSDDPSAASDCESWLATFGPSGLGTADYATVESGELVSPPDLMPWRPAPPSP